MLKRRLARHEWRMLEHPRLLYCRSGARFVRTLQATRRVALEHWRILDLHVLQHGNEPVTSHPGLGFYPGRLREPTVVLGPQLHNPPTVRGVCFRHVTLGDRVSTGARSAPPPPLRVPPVGVVVGATEPVIVLLRFFANAII